MLLLNSNQNSSLLYMSKAEVLENTLQVLLLVLIISISFFPDSQGIDWVSVSVWSFLHNFSMFIDGTVCETK